MAEKTSNVCHIFDMKVIVTTATHLLRLPGTKHGFVLDGMMVRILVGGGCRCVEFSWLSCFSQYRLEEMDGRMGCQRNLKDFQFHLICKDLPCIGHRFGIYGWILSILFETFNVSGYSHQPSVMDLRAG